MSKVPFERALGAILVIALAVLAPTAPAGAQAAPVRAERYMVAAANPLAARGHRVENLGLCKRLAA